MCDGLDKTSTGRKNLFGSDRDLLSSGESGMPLIRNSLAVTAIGLMAAQPCLAADLVKEPGMGQRSSSAFAGLNVRMPLGQAVRGKPSARLQFTTTHSYRDMRTGSVETFKAQGLEIGAAKLGKPTVYLNGQSKAEIDQRLGLFGRMHPAAEIILAVGVVAFGVYLVATLD